MKMVYLNYLNSFDLFLYKYYMSCSFVLTKRNDLGKGYGNVYLLSTLGSQQTVISGNPVKFNNYSKLSGVSWLTQSELTIINDGTYEINFTLNYLNIPDIQVALFVNGNAMIGGFGQSSPLLSGTRQLVGSYVLKLATGDKLKLINIGSNFVLKPSSLENEIIANLIVSEK